MLEELKALLGDAAANYTDAQLNLFIRLAIAEVEDYCHRDMETKLEYLVLMMAQVKANRANTEGLDSQSFNGVSESFIDGYPDTIKALLNSKRKIRVM